VATRRQTSDEARLRRRIASNVRRLRSEREISAVDASESVGLHWRLWQKVEAGDNNITLATLTRIADALDVDPRDLLA
jgi:DNA-binding Xre family transcriptional regulator